MPIAAPKTPITSSERKNVLTALNMALFIYFLLKNGLALRLVIGRLRILISLVIIG